MSNIARAAEYRYFSFTYFYGKAYLRLTADREMTAPSRA